MLPGTFSSVRPTKCGSLPTPSQQHVCRHPQRQASITYSDEVPQVKVEHRETAAPLARACVRACQSVSVFCLHLFTHMPQNSDSQINRGEDFAQKPPHFAFSSGLFLRQSTVFQHFAPFHHKKMGNSINVCDRRNHCAVCFFEQGFGRRRNAQTFHSRRVAKHIFTDRCSTRHGRRREFLPRSGVKQSSRCFLTGGRESVNPNRQSLHTYQTMNQHLAPYG